MKRPTGRHRPWVGHVVAGWAAASIAWFWLTAYLFRVHPVLGIVCAAIPAAMLIWVVAGASGRLPEAEALADEMAYGGQDATSSGVIVVIVIGWTVISTAVAVAIALASLSLQLDQTGNTIAGVSILVSWILVLVVGSILTLRWVRRR